MERSSSKGRKRSCNPARSSTTRSTNSTPYSGGFEQKMIDSGVYPHNRASKPLNLPDIKEHMARPRASLSPSQFDDGRFEEFFEIHERSTSETKAMAEVIPIIAGEGRMIYHSEMDTYFTNIAPVAEDVTIPKPDVYDGTLPERIHPRVRHSLNSHIVPSSETSLPAAPNFFIEGKSARGRADVAKRQACHDGAVGARAMHSLQNYGSPVSQYDCNARSYSSTYHNGTGTLQLYCTHMTRPQVSGGRPEYHMTHLRSYAMTGYSNYFREGATAFRNLRELAQSQRDTFIDQANSAAEHAPTPSPLTTVTESRESRSTIPEAQSDDTSADELAAEEPNTKRHRRRSGEKLKR